MRYVADLMLRFNTLQNSRVFSPVARAGGSPPRSEGAKEPPQVASCELLDLIRQNFAGISQT